MRAHHTSLFQPLRSADPDRDYDSVAFHCELHQNHHRRLGGPARRRHAATPTVAGPPRPRARTCSRFWFLQDPAAQTRLRSFGRPPGSSRFSSNKPSWSSVSQPTCRSPRRSHKTPDCIRQDQPLDRDLDIVTTALSGPFRTEAWADCHLEEREHATVAVYDPLAPFPADDIKRVTGWMSARGRHARGRRSHQQELLRLKTSLTHAEKTLAGSWLRSIWATRVPLDGNSGARSSRGAVVRALDRILSYAFEQRCLGHSLRA